MISENELKELCSLANVAGNAIMEVYNRDYEIEVKNDRSPLTEADLKSNQIIVDGLKSFFPKIPILSEEEKKIPYADRKNWQCFFCVDPLDGTKEFIKKNGEFTVNIALIEEGVPVFGVIFAPALQRMYYALKNHGAMIYENGKTREIKCIPIQPDSEINVAVSRSHLDENTNFYLKKLAAKGYQVKRSPVGSSLKFCHMADGLIQIYPRFAPTMEWDIAAGHCILSESGGSCIDVETMTTMKYNKENLRNPSFMAIASNNYNQIQSLL